MIRIGHMFDASAGWEQRVGVTHLLDRLSSERFTQTLAAVEPAARRGLRHLDGTLEALPRFGSFDALSAPAAVRFAARRDVTILHAWGVSAAMAAGAIGDMPVVVHLFDPLAVSRHVKRLRTLARPKQFVVVCSCGIVQRRLIEGGFPPELAVVVRPGVDFGLTNRIRRGPLRETLGIGPSDFVTLAPAPVSRAGGQMEGIHAAMLRNAVSGGYRVILPGDTRETWRIQRFMKALPVPDVLVTPGEEHPFEHLVAISDALLVSPRGDISTTAIAWAMASGATVIGSAVHAVAEMIANKVNGLLCKPVAGRSLVGALSRHLDNREAHGRLRETARGQAYEVFGLRRYAEQIETVYENVLAGRPPGEGVTDSAVEA